MHKRYRGYLIGETLLLGGVRSVTSSDFKTKKEANDWLWAMKQGNTEAGRKIARSGIIVKTIKT